MRQMIERHGNNVVDAWRHLRPNEPTYGFTMLYEAGLLHLSIEALMLQKEWRDVFTREKRAQALNALAELEPQWRTRVDDDYTLKE